MNHIKTARMVEEIHARFPLSPEVYKALLKVDRELFVPSGLRHLAFMLDALPMSENQWISSPLTVAKMSEYLEPKGADSVLEIGCGSGYQAVVLSHLFRRVFSIERIERLLLEARGRLKTSQISNVNTKLDDGQKGWAQYAPYDRILFSASIPSIPQAIADQLEEGGILIAPIEEGNAQVIKRFEKYRGQLKETKILEHCVFVPIKSGIA